ncbi:MAG: type II toxin-antitoxin system VapC family toxin [Thermomicrobiales bacterium]
MAGDPAAVMLLRRLSSEDISISIISFMEAYPGIYRAPDRPRHDLALARFLEGVALYPISVPVAQRCAELRESLRVAGKRTNSRAFDLLIAATAMEHDLVLVTRNDRDYRDIPGLVLFEI